MIRFIGSLLLVGGALAAQSQTPPPRRTLVDSQPTQKKAAATDTARRDAGSSAYDAVAASTENLNTIRDSNVRRLGDGCSPDVAARIGEIRVQLGLQNAPQRKDPSADAALLALAANWFKPAGEAATAPHAKPGDLLESVLPGSTAKPAPAQDPANLQAEMSRLLATCSGARR